MVNVGQLVMVGFKGKSLPQEVKKWIQTKDLGGVFYFPPADNMGPKEEMAELSREIQSAANDLPLFIAIDQEGGTVQAWNEPYCDLIPKAADLGKQYLKAKDPKIILNVVTKLARELREIGVNIDFAPILDVNTNPDNPIIGDRSYAPSPVEASEITKIVIQGLHQEGILACGKHFPGHGDTDLDSHKTLPTVSHDRTRLESIEMVPFAENIKAGLETIMSAHVLYPALDPEYPGTISKKIITGYLRERMKFNGIIFTDDMAMRGLADSHDLYEGGIRAIEAGCDIILTCTEYEKHAGLFEALEKAVKNGRLSEQRIQQSIDRITRIKKKWLLKEVNQVSSSERAGPFPT